MDLSDAGVLRGGTVRHIQPVQALRSLTPFHAETAVRVQVQSEVCGRDAEEFAELVLVPRLVVRERVDERVSCSGSRPAAGSGSRSTRRRRCKVDAEA